MGVAPVPAVRVVEEEAEPLLVAGRGEFAHEIAAGRLPIYGIQAMVYRDGWLWAACGGGGLVVVDADDVHEPQARATLDAGLARSVAFAGPWLCLGTEDGLRVVDVADPLAPSVVGSGPPSIRPVSLAWSGEWLAATTETGTLAAFDLSDPAAPAVLHEVDLPGPPTLAEVALRGRLAAVTLGTSGVSLWRLEGAVGLAAGARRPGRPELGAAPNPFNPSTTLRFVLEQPRSVRLSVRDLAGRRVATLLDGPLPAGEHARRFDGAGLASGLYVAVLEDGGEHRALKLLLAK